MRRSFIAALASHHIQPRSLLASVRLVHSGHVSSLPSSSRVPSPHFSRPSHRSIANVRQVDGVPSISVQDARKDLSAFQYVVDVREPDEVKHGMIDGAYHIPLGQVVRDMSQPMVQQIKGKPVLVYCRSGKRSAMAVMLLNKAGFNATNLIGGYVDWISSEEKTAGKA